MRIEGNLETTTPVRTKIAPDKRSTRNEDRAKLAKKGGAWNIMCWNKGNSTYLAKNQK